ncbi:MAG TPA: hypothetical protein P5253_07250, partial [bacterium]|nr:hypothetical protein [bacterium]
ATDASRYGAAIIFPAAASIVITIAPDTLPSGSKISITFAIIEMIKPDIIYMLDFSILNLGTTKNNSMSIAAEEKAGNNPISESFILRAFTRYIDRYVPLIVI